MLDRMSVGSLSNSGVSLQQSCSLYDQQGTPREILPLRSLKTCCSSGHDLKVDSDLAGLILQVRPKDCIVLAGWDVASQVGKVRALSEDAKVTEPLQSRLKDFTQALPSAAGR